MPLTDLDLDASATAVITSLAGPDARIRDDQRAAVAALVIERRRALVVQATGWGKSAVYWTAAHALRASGSGPVLVVSPLLSLMRDQVAAAARAGLVAVTLNSSNPSDWAQILEQVDADKVDVLLISPERLASPSFAPTLAAIGDRLGLLVIDEAHCLSSWGHDFRPDYTRIARLLAADPNLPVLATTATANDRVTDDVAATLGPDTFVQRGPLARTSLHLSVVPGLTALQRYAYVDDALTSLEGSGIVYALTVAEAGKLTDYLASRGHNVTAYTGQMDTADRERVEDDLRANRVKAVIATSALGMGYDKPDLAFCLHVGSPPSPIEYYQQVGRAGRALDTAVVVLLPASTDERLWEWFATASIPDPDEARRVLDAVTGSELSTIAIETATGVRRSRVDALCKTLAVDGAVMRVAGGWTATGQPWVYDHARYSELVTARRREAALMRDYAGSTSCLEGVLRVALSDPIDADYACGRCSVCTGVLPAGLPSAPSGEALAAATAHLRAADVILEPRKQYPTGMTTRSGRISADLEISSGRALAFADDPAWTDVPALLAGPDQDAPEWLVDAVIAVLARWGASWGPRPVAVVPMPSSTRPRLISTLAAAIAARGRLTLVEPLTASGPAPERGIAPAARARVLENRLSYAGEPVPHGPVLLVDDTWRTGWTMTLAGGLLRENGAAAVLPLVIHSLP